MNRSLLIAFCLVLSLGFPATAQTPSSPKTVHLKDIMLRDACILPDKEKGIYYLTGPGRGASVIQYTSKDLLNWTGPKTIFKTPEKFWGDTVINSIWAPELQFYKGKYYLFLTFSTNKLLAEQ